MAVVSNVFGYINNNKWGVFASYNYAQIISMDTAAEVVALLNTDAVTYYTTLSTQGYIYDGAISNEAKNGKYNWSDGTVQYSGGIRSVGPKSYKVFTISWTENNDPATVANSVVYSNDAAGLTRGVSKEFDQFFGYYACRLSSAGQESDKVVQSYSGNTVNLPLGSLATATSGNDVMICFPKRGIKMSKSGSTITLSITDEPDAAGYQYYAFNKGILNSDITGYSLSVPVSKFYLGAFEMGGSAGATSLPTGTPGSGTFTAHCENARNKNGSQSADSNGRYANSTWSAMRRWQRCYINALYMMKYGHPDSSRTIGQGRTSGGSALARGHSWTQNSSLATWGDTGSSTTSMRLFGLENRWGNVSEWCMGIKTSGSYVCKVNLWNDTGDTNVSTVTNYRDTGYGAAVGTNGRPATSIAGDNKGMFIPTAVYSSQDWSKGYCDRSLVNSGFITYVGGIYSSGLDAGAFNLAVNSAPSGSGASLGSRLVYL